MNDFNTLIHEDLQKIEQQIARLFHSDAVPWIEDMAKHILIRRGKRLRASLILLLSGALSPHQPKTEIHSLACVIEMIHTAMLLHDDVIDGAMLRRLKPCAHTIWGPTASILMGDYIYAQSFLLIQSLNNQTVTSSLVQSTTSIISGELKQQSLLHNPNITLDDYHFIIDKKTAELFSVALQNTARLISPEHTAWAASWGKDFGRLYQIVDDLIDIQSSKDNTDKSLGQDLKQGLVTLPTLLLLQTMSSSDKTSLERMITHSDTYDESQYHLWITHYNIEKKLVDNIQSKSQDLIISLDQTLDPSPYKTALINLVHYVGQRTH